MFLLIQQFELLFKNYTYEELFNIPIFSLTKHCFTLSKLSWIIKVITDTALGCRGLSDFFFSSFNCKECTNVLKRPVDSKPNQSL